jgi:hypothetical protein
VSDCALYILRKISIFNSLSNILVKFYDLPNSEINLLIKTYAVVTISFAARGCEAVDLNFENFGRTVSEKRTSDGTPPKARYVLKHKRAKQTGQASTDGNEAFIIGEKEISTIDEYFDCFLIENRIDRFFRKLIVSKSGKIVGTKAVVGKNKLAGFSKIAAAMLGKKDPDKYTGHSWRRSSKSSFEKTFDFFVS